MSMSPMFTPDAPRHEDPWWDGNELDFFNKPDQRDGTEENGPSVVGDETPSHSKKIEIGKMDEKTVENLKDLLERTKDGRS